jgi:simple sugar transport system permease protein
MTTGILAITLSENTVVGLLFAAIQLGAMIYLASLGELIAERAGVLNLGVEGMMAMGAVGGFVVGIETGNPWVGVIGAAAVGAAFASIHGWFAVVLGADQVVSGLALTFLGVGLANFWGTDYEGLRADVQLVGVDWGPLSDIPWVGRILFSQSPMAYLALLLGLATWFLLARTRLGLAIRAAGESAATADAAGHSVTGLRLLAVAVGGACAGLSGAYLSLSISPGWSIGLVAGRGWIAVALVIFGAWRAGRVAVGALLFGLALALPNRTESFDLGGDPIVWSMLPYVLTIVVMIVGTLARRDRPPAAPAALGRPFRREER